MNLLDHVIGYFAPSVGVRRFHARATMSQIEKLIGTSTGPYNAAKLGRLNTSRRVALKENEVSGSQLDRLRADSWDQYRNNPSAKKIVRSLESKVVGRGMQPESLATRADGTPHNEFRARAKKLWGALHSGFDARGLPGQGGLTMSGLQKLALRSVILSGDTFYRLRPIDSVKKARHDLPISLTLQMIDSCRLADDSEIPAESIATGHTIWRGIELNADGERVAYWIRSAPIYAGANTLADAIRIPVEKMGHLFIEEDIDQLVGTPWMASIILRARRTDDLESNVLTATAMAACVVGTYSKPTGAARFGLGQGPDSVSSADGTDLTDTDGNSISKIQPGMIVNKGKDGSFDLISPNQPNMNPEAFVQHLQRGIATGMPGIKSSTITGDYRNSSFSSERSADNDTWPEVNDIQEWFASSFCQPIWETVLRSAMIDGYFDGVISIAEFQSEPGRFSAAKWQGPVALSINPKVDVEAAAKRIQNGQSSVQMECAKNNVNWRDVLNDAAELYAVAKEKGIPPEVINNIMGVDTADIVPVPPTEPAPAKPQTPAEVATNGKA